ncbi:ComEC/Rec2 family competence protein [Cellulomonas sp. Marseille-Q8402]
MRDEPVDVRLVPAALAVWGVAMLVLPWSAAASLTAGVLAGVAGVAVLVARGVPSAGRARGQVVLVLGAVAVLLLTTAGQARTREAGGLRSLADDRARVQLVGVVRSTPRALAGADADAGSLVGFLLVVRSVEVDGGRSTGTGAAVDVLAPASAAGLAYGTSVALTARLSPLPDRARRGVARARATATPQVRAPPTGLLRVADGLRGGLARTASDVPGDAGRLLPAVAVGDTRDVGDLDEAMRASGLAHLTAVSGAHFSMLGAIVLAATGRFRVPRRWRWLPVAAVTAGFVAVVQPGSSVVRAAVMGAVGLLGIVAGRPARSVPALACAVLVLLVVDPWLAREIGFALSVVATAGIALLGAPLARRWSSTAPRRPTGGRDGGRGGTPPGSSRPPAGPIATALAVPVAAQAVCAPVVLVLSPAVPTYAVLANVVVAPAVAPATVGGLLAAVLGPWWPTGAEWCAQLAGAGCWWIAAVARTATGLPGAQVAWAGGVLGQVLLGSACAAGLVLVLRCRRGMAP